VGAGEVMIRCGLVSKGCGRPHVLGFNRVSTKAKPTTSRNLKYTVPLRYVQ